MVDFTDDEEGKRIVNAEGDEIGMVKEVRGGTVHVDPDPGITDSVKSKLGWGDSDEDTYTLDESNVESISDDEVRLQRM